jgi:alpha-1,2-mannosyltransferase
MTASPPRTGLDPTTAQRLFLALLLLLFLVLSVRYSLKALENRSAYERWRTQLLDLSDGVDISQRYNYPNPPIMAVLLEPLAHLPPLTGALVWYYLKVAMALTSIVWVLRVVGSETPFPLWAQGLTVLFALKPIVDDLTHGNVNLLILFLIVAALVAHHHQWNLTSGIVVALAIACKLTPALFVPYFVWKRQWKVLAGIVVGLALFLWPGVAPSLRLGFAGNQQELVSWYHGMVEPFLVEGKVTSEHSNQSWPGLLARLMQHRPSFSTWVQDVYTPTRYDNLASLSPQALWWLSKGAIVLFGLVVCWTCRAAPGKSTGAAVAAEFGLIVLGMLLFSERTWKHHAVTLLIPFAVLCHAAANQALSRGVRLGVLSCATVAFILILSTGLGAAREDAWGPLTFAKAAQVYGAYTWAFLVLGVGQVVFLTARPAKTANVGELPLQRAA